MKVLWQMIFFSFLLSLAAATAASTDISISITFLSKLRVVNVRGKSQNRIKFYGN
jgi:hypothetical protein